jgi:hypothetical protein
MLIKLEGGARQTLGSFSIAFFPFFQVFVPECIAERVAVTHLLGSSHYSPEDAPTRKNIDIGGNREENDSPKNCNSQISHSFILLDNFFKQ